MNLTKNYKQVRPGVFMGHDGFEFKMDDIQKNGLTAKENIIRGFRSSLTRKFNLVLKAEAVGINVKNLVKEYLSINEDFDNDYSTFGILSKAIKKTTEESFKRYGDVNYLNRNLKRNYISKEGTPIDVMVMELNEIYYSNITTDDVIEFVTTYDNGIDEYELINKISDFKNLFKEMVGFKIDFEFAKIFLEHEKNGNTVAFEDDFFGEVNIDCPF